MTFVDLFSFDRNMLVGALQYFPDVQKHFQRLSIKIVFRRGYHTMRTGPSRTTVLMPMSGTRWTSDRIFTSRSFA